MKPTGIIELLFNDGRLYWEDIKPGLPKRKLRKGSIYLAHGREFLITRGIYNPKRNKGNGGLVALVAEEKPRQDNVILPNNPR